MLDDDEVIATVRNLWSRHRLELPDHDRVYRYVRGLAGVPEVPDGAGDELQDIAALSVKNILGLVRDAFAQGLSVTGFRSPTSAEDDPVWTEWQRHHMDARQAEVHRSTVTYGTSYLVGLRDSPRPRSPRQMFAVYSDPQLDQWPVYALETWVDRTERRALRRGLLLDSTHAYPVTLGTVTDLDRDEQSSVGRRITAAIDTERDPFEHDGVDDGEPVCPVVRFVNARDAEDMVVGEVAPLITLQRAINAVNFDRLVVSRFGAFPQRYAIGWAASSEDELVRASMARLMAFDDETVKLGAFPAASVEPYNMILEEMLGFAALTAQVPVAGITGRIDNLAAETVALVNAPYQRKLDEKRDSLGESWEQFLRLQGGMNNIKVDDSAEVVWRDTESRSFAQVVDGIQKLNASGVPIDTLLEDIPGWSQRRLNEARSAMRRAAGRQMVVALGAAAAAARTDPAVADLAGRSGTAG